MAEHLLNFSIPLDVNVLEQVVQSVYQGSPQQMQAAQRTLSELQERIAGEDAASALNWFRVDQILESGAASANTRFYALQILESAIKYRWKTLPAEQQVFPLSRQEQQFRAAPQYQPTVYSCTV